MRPSAHLVLVLLVAIRAGATEHATPALGDTIGRPLSEWYFALKATTGGHKSGRYCGFGALAQPDLVVICDEKSPAYQYQYSLVFPGGINPPLVTGQKLLLVSRNAGLCGTSSLEAAGNENGAGDRDVRGAAGGGGVGSSGGGGHGTSSEPAGNGKGNGAADASGAATGSGSGSDGGGGARQQPSAGGRRLLLLDPSSSSGGGRIGSIGATAGSLISKTKADDDDSDEPDAAPVACGVDKPWKGPSSWSLHLADSPDKLGHPIDLDNDWLFLREGERYCRVAHRSGGAHHVLVCDKVDAKDAAKFQFERIGQPYASLTSTFTGADCAIRGFTMPPPHDISCAGPGPSADRMSQFTLLLENPGTELVSGSAVGIFTFTAGLVGMPLQQCCAQAASPHIVDCYVPNQEVLPPECWYYVYRVSKSESAHGADGALRWGDDHHGSRIVDGDTVRLMSAAHDRHCSVRHDGTLLCVDREVSYTPPALFTLHLGKPGGSGPMQELRQ
ncbi:hypothetical protein FOA52_004601 [Chlamydomonas sp. UWO 241]|nr:hypothetical protein FOA52_004601 [Chlamydomonas sp. UWO 241]